MDVLIMLLRIVHIAGGVFWVGGAFTFFVFVAPSLQVLSPRDRQAFVDEFAQRRRYATLVLAAATLTVIAGAWLLWIRSGGLNMAYMTSPSGLGFALGGLAGLVAWLIAAFVIGPTFGRLGELGRSLVDAGRPPTPEEGARLAALNRRLALASRALLVLLATAVVLMAVSRYL